jgi:LPS-assembly lipoprotein
MSSSDSLRRAVLLSLAGGALAGCGFHMRQPPRMGFGRIALAGFEPRSPMARELRRQLGAGARVVDSPGQADLVLHALDDVRERSVVGSTGACWRELIPRVELLLSRDLSYSETAALAKEVEEAELFREMQADVAEQVLRRLASLKI